MYRRHRPEHHLDPSIPSGPLILGSPPAPPLPAIPETAWLLNYYARPYHPAASPADKVRAYRYRAVLRTHIDKRNSKINT
jgi:hypothetical protein